MPNTPSHLRYSTDHIWAKEQEGQSVVRIGVTDFAQEALGDVIDVTLPQVGDDVQAEVACADVESTKSVSDVVSPVSGTVVARNEGLAGSPELVNSDPYEQGWLLDIEVDPSKATAELAALQDAGAYARATGG
ncbi:glycine cleavage system protein GcvH [Streptomyces sp. 049-1]|uniref:glycine cleavage system protein GcvH n=1 Tax=Streptomyces sp. 049-1 TaxID=2789264 RepID=UPI00397F1188